MLTSDLNSNELRPARKQVYDPYRSLPREVVAAAVRAGVGLVLDEGSSATAPSLYEFPGDLTNNRNYRRSEVL